MKKVLKVTFILVIFCGMTVSAQTAQPIESANYSLQQCIDYALQNSSTMANATLDEEIAKAKVGEIRASGLPQVNLEGTVIDNLQIQRQFLPASFVDQNANPKNLVPLPFGAKYTGLATATATQLLFSSSYIIGLQASKVYVDLARKSKSVSKNTIIQNVNKAYLMVLVNSDRKNLFISNIARLDSTLREAKALNKNGFVETIDVDRIQVASNNLLIEKQKFDQLYELSVVLLKYQMGMPLNASLSLSQSLKDFETTTLAEIQKVEVDFNARPEFLLLQTQKNLNMLDYKNSKYSKIPSLVFFTNGGFNTGSNKLEPFNWYWIDYMNIGFQFKMNVFDGFQRAYKLQTAKLNIQKTENSIQNLKQSIDLQAQQAQISFNNNVKSFQTQKENLKLAEKVVFISQKKYKQGVGSNLELTTAESALKEAQINYYNALYETLSSKVDLDFALGNLK